MDKNFNCLPDFDKQFCPYFEKVPNDASKSAFCEPECHAELRGLVPGFIGEPRKYFAYYERNYRECVWYKKEQAKE